MNRIYSLAALVLIGGSLSAQRLPNTQLQGFSKTATVQHAAHPTHGVPTPVAAQRDIVFSEDFANGLAGNNGGLGAWTTSGVNGNVWRYTHTGPVGAYSDPVDDLIGSATVANGFIIFNSDSANTNFTVDPPVIVSNIVQLVGSITSPTINLASANVELRFASRMRYCCRQEPGHYVEVSTDGGTTWPTRINIDVQIPFYATPSSDIATNDDPGTRMYQINMVNAVIANPANVKIRFTQEGTAGNALTHYHWQIDDVQLVDLPATDMRMYTSSASYWNLNEAFTYDSLVYPLMPLSELRGRTLSQGYFNNGNTTANNVEAHFTTDDGYDETVSLGDVAPGFGDTAKVANPPGWVPTATVGTHHIYFSLTSDGTDENLSDNADTARVIVTENEYARDEDSRDNNLNDTDDGTAFKIGNKFYVNADEMLYGIDVAFASVSAVGPELNAQLLDVADGTYPPLAETGYHTLVTSDLSALGGNTMVSFIFDSPVQLTAGMDYMVAVQHFGGADVRIATSGVSPAQTSNLYQTSSDTWFYVTTTPMVRMNFNPSIGIAESDFQNGIGLGQNYPNPANNGSTRIDVSLEQSAHVNMVIRDISGKLVQTLTDGTMAPGVHHIDVNTNNLGAGVYFYTLTTNNMVSTKRMTVVR